MDWPFILGGFKKTIKIVATIIHFREVRSGRGVRLRNCRSKSKEHRAFDVHIAPTARPALAALRDVITVAGRGAGRSTGRYALRIQKKTSVSTALPREYVSPWEADTISAY